MHSTIHVEISMVNPFLVGENKTVKSAPRFRCIASTRMPTYGLPFPLYTLTLLGKIPAALPDFDWPSLFIARLTKCIR